jgi:hypothetical protein
MSDEAREATFVPVAPLWWLTNAGGVATTGLLAARTGRRSLRWLFWGAVAVHVTEALYTYSAARRAGFTRHAARWALQTLGVGFPSLFLLRAAARDALVDNGQ